MTAVVIFAALSVLPQLTLAQIVVWGQFVVGIGLAGFLLAPMFNVPEAFGNLLEMGFEGGHGTVGGMRDNFVMHGWEDGVALGITVATIGMISGIVIGMVLVNWAYLPPLSHFFELMHARPSSRGRFGADAR